MSSRCSLIKRPNLKISYLSERVTQVVTIITMCVISPDEELVMPSSMSRASLAPDREYINRRLTIGSGEKEDDDDTVPEREELHYLCFIRDAL